MSAGAFNIGLRQVVLTLGAAGATSFILRRRKSAEADFAVLAANVPATGGAATYTDTIEAEGDYVYETAGVNGTGEGQASATVAVAAAW